MMKQIVMMMMLILTAIGMQAQKQTSYIKAEGAWYMIYDKTGKMISTPPAN